MENYELTDELLDGLIELLNLLSQPTVRAINPTRYWEMMETAANLKHLLVEENESGEFSIHIDDKFHSGGICAELEDLTVANVPLFLQVLSTADAFEVYPLANGKIRVGLTFQGVIKAVC